MPKTATQQERQLVKLIDKIPVTDEEKNAWTERIRNGEMSEDLAGEIREKIVGLQEPEGDEHGQANKTLLLTELAQVIKQWRFSSQSHNFGKR